MAESVIRRVTPVGPAARAWLWALEDTGFPIYYRRFSETDKAIYGARWTEATRWMDRVAVEAAAAHPHLSVNRLRGLAANAYGYAVTPLYPCDDRDEIFHRMLSGLTERTPADVEA